MENQKDKSEVVSSLMKRVRQNVTDCFAYTESPEEQEESFRQLFLEHPNVLCRTEKPVEEDLYEDRYDKFYVPADALRAELVTRRGLNARQIRLFIDVMDNDFETGCMSRTFTRPKRMLNAAFSCTCRARRSDSGSRRWPNSKSICGGNRPMYSFQEKAAINPAPENLS